MRPLRHANHKRPVTRRDFLAQGFLSGAAMVMAPSLFGLFKSREAYAQATASCGISGGAGRIPFVCFDLAGGASTAGSNVLVGGPGGQLDLLSAAGYEKLGLPRDMLPSLAGQVNTELGLAFHADSAFLRGILSKTSAATRANVNGCVICARSENDTGQQPAQPHVWHQQGGRQREPGHADRHRALGLGRQLPGADVDDRPHCAAGEGGPRLGRDRPGRHRAARAAARPADAAGR